jgi:hypothetical protein
MTKRILLLLIIIQFTFYVRAQQPIDLAESTVKIGGLTNEEVYFGFAKGDKIVFNFEESRGKEIKEVEIMEMPSTSKFMDYKTSKIENKTLTVSQTGIYKFRFYNSAIGGRVCSYKIQRIPANDSTADFNSNVYWQSFYDTSYLKIPERYVEEKYITRTIVPASKYYINSGSNATFSTGKSRIVIPVTLPSNTVEWYYEFTASRDESQIDQVMSNFKLAEELSTLIDQSGIVGFTINMLTRPPGGDVCDIYLLDNYNAGQFKLKNYYQPIPIGSRENLASGIVKMSQSTTETIFLGIKNPDATHGIHVAVEVIAITHEQQERIRHVEVMNVKEYKEPYLEDQTTSLELTN